MERLVVTTTVYAPPPEVFAFLEDFPGYATYSEYLTEVRSEGRGEGRRYALTFSWWKLSYTARTEVTSLDPPRRLEWRVRSDLDAHGRWQVDPVTDLPDDAPVDADDLGAESEGDADAAADGDGDAAEDDGDPAAAAGDAAEPDPADAPASRVTFVANYDPGSVHGGMLDLPRLVSLDWVVQKAKPLIEQEATRVVERAVADIEGSTRAVDLDVTIERVD